MGHEPFELIEQAAQRGDRAGALETLVTQFRTAGDYPLLFEARLMQKRHELGLPLIQTTSLADLTDATRRAYEDAYIDAAREVGALFLERGDVPRAWAYFRAIGETASVAAALEKVQPGEGIEPLIEIAFHDRVNPRKGFELILANYGTCSAITNMEQYPAREGRADCVRLLVRKLHADLVASLTSAIEAREGQAPAAQSITDLVQGRAWLFEDNNYHIDTSHLGAVVRFSLELEDEPSLRLALELTEYGRRLSPMFQYRGSPPFEDVYPDHAAYLRALLGEDADQAVVHFRSKAAQAESDEMGNFPAQVLVNLLARLNRYDEAITASVEYLRGPSNGPLLCPSLAQLCQMAGAPRRLMELARQQGDLLNFAAAALESSP